MLKDDYCKNHKDLAFCKKINRRAPNIFCELACRGDWKRWYRENTEVLRKRYRPALTDEQKNNRDLVSVTIPSRNEKDEHVRKTVQSLRETAIGPIEILIAYDGYVGPEIDGAIIIQFREPVGQRKAHNFLAKKAKGKYLFRVDAHCAMSEAWDARMKTSCGSTDLVVSTFDVLDTETWKGKGKDTGTMVLDKYLRNIPIRGWKDIKDRKIEEETMAIGGCAWMMQKDYYWALDGCNESYGSYGALGSEWALKVWLTGGRCLIRTDTVCYHHYRPTTPYHVDIRARLYAFDRLYQSWVKGEDKRRTKPYEWLKVKFDKYLKAAQSFKMQRKEDAEVTAVREKYAEKYGEAALDKTFLRINKTKEGNYYAFI